METRSREAAAEYGSRIALRIDCWAVFGWFTCYRSRRQFSSKSINMKVLVETFPSHLLHRVPSPDEASIRPHRVRRSWRAAAAAVASALP
jgi:hypothetical protein